MARRERCEGGCDPKIAPVVIHDSEGTPLCIGCWNSMIADAHRAAMQRQREKTATLRRRLSELKAELELWREYEQFLFEQDAAPTKIAITHGWKCPPDVFERGAEYRRRLRIPRA